MSKITIPYCECCPDLMGKMSVACGQSSCKAEHLEIDEQMARQAIAMLSELKDNTRAMRLIERITTKCPGCKHAGAMHNCNKYR
jgi:hypothetical protein